MGSINHGTQTMTFAYYLEATALNFGKRLLDVMPVGIYSGGYCTRVTDSQVSLSTLVAEIKAASAQINVRTAVVAALDSTTLDSGSISSATPYLVLRWAFSATVANYVEVHAIASLAAKLENDVVIGKCVFSGATLVSFDYADRTFPMIQSRCLHVEATPDTEMYVWLRGGVVNIGTAKVVIGDQKVGLFVAPSSPNSRIDLVYLDSDGGPQILQGTAAVSPSAPAYGNKLVLAEVTVVNGDTNLTWDRIVDARAFLSYPQSSASQMVESFGTDDISYNIAAWATIPNMTLTITTTGGRLHIVGKVPITYSTDELYNKFRLRVDGVEKSVERIECGYHQSHVTWNIDYYVQLSAGAHTIDLQWYREQLTSYQYGSQWKRYLQVVEGN